MTLGTRFIRRCLLLLASIAVLAPTPLHAIKTLIMTHGFNKPEFVPWQYHTFKRFIQGDFEFIVFNDAPNDVLFEQFETVCKELNILCVTVPQVIHSLPYLFRDDGIGGPSAECAETIQYMLNSAGFRHPGVVMVVDSDMFLVRPLHVENFLKGYDIAANEQNKSSPDGSVATYFLPNLMFFNMETLPNKALINFNLGVVNGVRTDAGGFNHYYVQSNPELRWRKIDVAYTPLSEEKNGLHSDVLEAFGNYPTLTHILEKPTFDFEFYADYHFMHFRAGSNWNNAESSVVAKKTQMFRAVMNELIKGE